MNIRLCNMTETIINQLFDGFQYDPDTFLEPAHMKPYVYTDEGSGQYFRKQKLLGRKHLAIMLEDTPVGEILLKDIDNVKGYCTLSIHLKNDTVKNRGIGTTAEILALQYAFGELEMVAVYANALIKNHRSRHVLSKVGFAEINRDAHFCYHVCNKT